jgi:uncharacterized membrane protein (UPF0127 family)
LSEASSLLDEQGRTVCAHCEDAAHMFARMRGLLGRKSLESGHGMLIRRTGSIHTLFMRFPIDAVFLDKQMRVRKIVSDLPRNRAAASLGARSVLELPAGEAARVGLKVGSRLAWGRSVRAEP